MTFIIVVILQCLHLAYEGVISSLSEIVDHPNVVLTVVRSVGVLLVLIALGATVILVVAHLVFSFLLIKNV